MHSFTSSIFFFGLSFLLPWACPNAKARILKIADLLSTWPQNWIFSIQRLTFSPEAMHEGQHSIYLGHCYQENQFLRLIRKPRAPITCKVPHVQGLEYAFPWAQQSQSRTAGNAHFMLSWKQWPLQCSKILSRNVLIAKLPNRETGKKGTQSPLFQ